MVWLLLAGCAWMTGRSDACREHVEAVCDVCGPDSDACSGYRRMLDVCEDDGTCRHKECAEDHQRLQRDPKGYGILHCRPV